MRIFIIWVEDDDHESGFVFHSAWHTSNEARAHAAQHLIEGCFKIQSYEIGKVYAP